MKKRRARGGGGGTGGGAMGLCVIASMLHPHHFLVARVAIALAVPL